MILLLAGLALFFGTHLFSAFRSRRAGQDVRVRLGTGPFMGVYSVVAGLGFGLMLYGYGQARPGAAALYPPPDWGLLLALVITLPALILLTAAYTPMGHIKCAVRHPMLLGVLLWAVGHLAANGDMASTLLFGAFAAYAFIALIAAMARDGNLPRPMAKLRFDLVAIAVGTSAYAALVIWLHPLLFGVGVLRG